MKTGIALFILVALSAAPAFAAAHISFGDFIQKTHGKLLKSDPALFCFKMKHAAESDFMFFRAFPELFYADLAREPEARTLHQMPPIFLVGDAHSDNLEREQSRGLQIPQYNDFEDSAEGPAALDIARVLTCSQLLADGSGRSASEIMAEARKAYKAGLQKSFKDWAAEAQNENAVENGSDKYIRWADKPEKPLLPKESERLAKAVGLNPSVWKGHVYNRGGMSSIGQPRILFLSARTDVAYELKGLDVPAVAAFTKYVRPGDAGQRVTEAYNILRQIPTQARAVYLDGQTWIFRKREPWKSVLSDKHETSLSRVMAGLLAQQHRNQAPVATLEGAANAATPSLVASSIRKIRAQRGELGKFLGNDAWDCTKYK